MNYQERRHVREVLMLKTTASVTECTDGFRVFDQRVLGPGYVEVTTIAGMVKLYPHLAEELLSYDNC